MVDVQLEMCTPASYSLGSVNDICYYVLIYIKEEIYSANLWRQVAVACNIFMMALKILFCYY